MKKSIKKTLSIALFGLVVSQAAPVSALTNTSDIENTDKKISIVQKNKNPEESNDDTDTGRQTDISKLRKTFFVVENHSTELPFGLGSESGTGYIKFIERADDFTLTFKNATTGKEIFSERYFFDGKEDENGDNQGVEKISFEMKMNGKDTYKIILKNHDGWPIQGAIHLKLKDKQKVTSD